MERESIQFLDDCAERVCLLNNDSLPIAMLTTYWRLPCCVLPLLCNLTKCFFFKSTLTHSQTYFHSRGDPDSYMPDLDGHF